jgi:hypothetical protein
MTAPPPERVLRLSLIGWGLGEMAMGRSRIGLAWMIAEALLLAAVVATTLLWADTTWYLVPFLLGVAFLVTWTAQAVIAFRRARSMQAASPAAPPRSPAAVAAWLMVPLLVWGTGFWLVGGHAATPSAVVDEFVSRWSQLEIPAAVVGPISGDDIDRVASTALANLALSCAIGELAAADCGANTKNLLRDVRFTISQGDEGHATAVAELVRFERFPSRFLGIFQGADLRPVPIETVLTLELETQPAALGAQRWTIVNARTY